MATIVDLNLYKQAKEEEKNIMKEIVSLNDKLEQYDLLTILMENCLDMSFLIKLPDGDDHFIKKEISIDKDMYKIILKAFHKKREEIINVLSILELDYER